MRASDKRARFIGEVYEAEGGTVLRDLFQGDDGGWLQDVALVERLVAERLEREAEAVRSEGWRWIEVAPDFPYGHHFGLRQLHGEAVPLSAAQEAERQALQTEYDQLVDEHASADELPEAVEHRLEEIEAALAGFDERPEVFDPAEIARAGAFLSIDADGMLRLERGFVRPEDEMLIASEPDPESSDLTNDHPNQAERAVALTAQSGGEEDMAYGAPPDAVQPEEDDGLRPLPDRLLTDLTAHRTLALRVTLGEHREVAFLAALHALCLRAFYSYGLHSCLELDLKSVAFTAQAPGLNDSALARTLTDRHQFWLATLPKQPEDLWENLSRLDLPGREALFAHCVGLSINAVHEVYNRRPRALAHADVLAQAVGLDMAAAGWTATVDNYLGRVTKARIVEAVREAKGDQAAGAIMPLKKSEMAEKAQALLVGTGWLPAALRTPGQAFATATLDAEAEQRVDAERAAPNDQHDADMPVGHWPVAAE